MNEIEKANLPFRRASKSNFLSIISSSPMALDSVLALRGQFATRGMQLVWPTPPKIAKVEKFFFGHHD